MYYKHIMPRAGRDRHSTFLYCHTIVTQNCYKRNQKKKVFFFLLFHYLLYNFSKQKIKKGNNSFFLNTLYIYQLSFKQQICLTVAVFIVDKRVITLCKFFFVYLFVCICSLTLITIGCVPRNLLQAKLSKPI